ncbi:DNA-binding GntR family transcriptional regulator [Rhodococcus sp. 27YEA15]|uniref:GntR family transcriptional regulator n=1 Tax=Rhodococcus sp. 27YEA15 TaxID=3156259 RepID=UPI003C7DBFF3
MSSGDWLSTHPEGADVRRSAPLGSQIADRLRRDVLAGVLLPGSRLSQNDLCKRFGTSRMPVRDALRSLLHEGLVNLDSARHIVVAPLSRKDLIDVFSIEAVLTGMAAERATARASTSDLDVLDRLHGKMLDADRDGRHDRMAELNWLFHRTINRLAGSRKLLLALRQVSIDLPRDFLNELPSWNNRSNLEHAQILCSMRARDSTAARLQMVAHVTESGSGLVDHLISRGIPLE